MSARPVARRLVADALVCLAVGALVACAGGENDTTPDASASPTPIGGACRVFEPVPGTPALAALLVAGGFTRPVDLQAPAGDCRLFVVEQPGRIRLVRDGVVQQTPFLDIVSRVRSSESERGLLGLAFHPDYAHNGRFFVNYTDLAGDTHISEFRADQPAAGVVSPDSERSILFVKQPFANHNGGGLAFGPDGFLYIGLGDGGSAGDPLGNAQNLGTLLGKMLRIDVDHGSPYAVPQANPFADRAGARGEIWDFGLRNPWRFAFDRQTGDLLIGDVGQSRIEEIDLGRAGQGGANYGWNVTEGSACYRPAEGCDLAGLTLPIAEYTHSEGCSITGGVVYRGRRLPGYQGTYFYSDYCQPFVRSLRVEGGRAVDQRDFTSSVGRGLKSVTSFGVDADGEVYIVDYDGEIYQIIPSS